MKKKMTKEEMEFWNIEPDELATENEPEKKKPNQDDLDFWGIDPETADEYIEMFGRLYHIGKK